MAEEVDEVEVGEEEVGEEEGGEEEGNGEGAAEEIEGGITMTIGEEVREKMKDLDEDQVKDKEGRGRKAQITHVVQAHLNRLQRRHFLIFKRMKNQTGQ